MPTRVLIAAVLVGLWGTSLLHAQDLGPADPAKLDAQLRAVVAAGVPSAGWTSTRSPRPDALSRSTTAGARRYAALVQTAPSEGLRRHGIPVNSAFEGVATVRATARQLYTLSRLPAVRYVSASPQLRPLNDEAAGLSGIRLLNNGRLNGTAYEGQGVTACIIDSGIDYTHLDFRSLADTTESRIRAIWDQTLTPQPDEQTPAARRDADFSGLAYGVEYTERVLEDELDGAPAGEVRQQDVSGHGSHVAGTFVGNSGADPKRRYTGMAPKADVVAVKTDFTGAGLLDGLRYCGELAADAGQPVVVNLSLGTQAGPHDGTLPFEEAITDWVRASEGRAVVAAAGNSGGTRIPGQSH